MLGCLCPCPWEEMPEGLCQSRRLAALSGKNSRGGSFLASQPQRRHERGGLCLASAAALPAPGPVLTPLLSPQVVPESGARERERHAAQQAGQVRPSPLLPSALPGLGSPLLTRKQQLLPGRAAARADAWLA